MTHPVFNRETILDSVVNLVPIGIIVFFVAFFVAFNPWTGAPSLERWLQLALLVFPFVLMVALTYETAKRI